MTGTRFDLPRKWTLRYVKLTFCHFHAAVPPGLAAFRMSGGDRMPPLSARPADPNVLIGKVDKYPCRTIADCDHALRILAARLRIISDPQMWRRHREDLDALIDRRLTLMHRDGG